MSDRVIHGTWASALAEHVPETSRDSRRRPILGGEALFAETELPILRIADVAETVDPTPARPLRDGPSGASSA